MAIEKFHRGELFAFPGMNNNLQPLHVMASQYCKEFYIERSSKVGTFGFRKTARATSSGFTGEEKKEHRNFIWIPWLPSGVNYASTQGKDILSGPFTGCYFIRYRQKGGDWRAAHIAADEKGDDGREIWNQFVETNQVEISCGFKPFPSGRDSNRFDSAWVGLITNTNRLFRIEAGPAQSSLKNMRKILSVEEVDSIPVSELRNLEIGR